MSSVNTAIDLGHGIRRLGALAGVPLYEVVKRHVSEAILLGQWPPGTVLPSEVTLAQQFGVAVGTARRALAELTAEGLLTRRRKTGTVVTGRSPHHSLRSFFQYFRLHGKDGALMRSRAEVVSVTRKPATTGQAGALGLAEDAEILELRRVRHLDDIAVMVDVMTLSADRLPSFPEQPDAVPELTYLFLLERYGIRISAVREQVTAALSDPLDARLLKLTQPTALLVIDEIAFDQNGTPTILGHHRARTDRHCYINEVR